MGIFTTEGTENTEPFLHVQGMRGNFRAGNASLRLASA